MFNIDIRLTVKLNLVLLLLVRTVVLAVQYSSPREDPRNQNRGAGRIKTKKHISAAILCKTRVEGREG